MVRVPGASGRRARGAAGRPQRGHRHRRTANPCEEHRPATTSRVVV